MEYLSAIYAFIVMSMSLYKLYLGNHLLDTIILLHFERILKVVFVGL